MSDLPDSATPTAGGRRIDFDLNSAPLILLDVHEGWCTAIQRQPVDVRIKWAVDDADLLSEAAARPGSAAVIQISSKSLADRVEMLAQLTNTPYHLALFAVGDFLLARHRSFLLELGFIEVFHSTIDADRLCQLAWRHYKNSICGQPRSLESEIAANLPWKPVPSPEVHKTRK